MLPFQNNLSQYIADLYASTSYYQPIYLYSNQENCWNSVNYNEQTVPSSNIQSVEQENQDKNQQATKTKDKTKKIKDRMAHESSVSCHSSEEDSEDSPDLKSRQKYGRNINSNIFHQMLKSIRCDEIFEQFLDKLMAHFDFELTKNQFLQLLQKRTSKLNPYVSTAKMNAFLNGISKYKVGHARYIQRTDSEFLKILRTMCKYYLSNIHLMYVFNKLKLQKQSKCFHIQGLRKILKIMIN